MLDSSFADRRVGVDTHSNLNRRGFLKTAARPLLRKPFSLDRLEALLEAVARGEAAPSDLTP